MYCDERGMPDMELKFVIRCVSEQCALQMLHPCHWAGPLAAPRSKSAVRSGGSHTWLSE